MPPPELNPLLNPLLSQNMGRWAQVYFTSPPEKRDQAVQDLVRELEAENSPGTQRRVPTPSSNQASSHAERLDREVGPITPALPVQATLIRCHACGRKNLTTQKFCGMCGTRLGEESAAAALLDDRSEETTPLVQSRENYAGFAARDHEDDFDPRDTVTSKQISRETISRANDNQVHSPRLDRNELSLFQGGDDHEYENREYNREYYDDEDPIFSTPPSSGSSGVVVGLLLVIVIGVAAYFGWPKLKTTLETLRAQPPAASAPANENATTQPTPTPNDSNGTPAAPVTENRPTRTSRAPAKPAVNASSKEPVDSAPALPQGVSRPPKPGSSEASAATGGGEELAVAEGYLNGTRGGSRNSAEAAKWLWKAIAKHNPEATLLLSDLYLKGDGVSKNCDQARVLLDSAALEGVKSAGDRLRHFQAFGCQ